MQWGLSCFRAQRGSLHEETATASYYATDMGQGAMASARPLPSSPSSCADTNAAPSI